jgi:hypothetical protein
VSYPVMLHHSMMIFIVHSERNLLVIFQISHYMVQLGKWKVQQF